MAKKKDAPEKEPEDKEYELVPVLLLNGMIKEWVKKPKE